MENSQDTTLKNDTYGGLTQEEHYILAGLYMERIGGNYKDLIVMVKEERRQERRKNKMTIYNHTSRQKRKMLFNRTE